MRSDAETRTTDSPSVQTWRAQLLLSRGPSGDGPSAPCLKRWLAAALAALVAPKCVLCLAGYLTLGGAAAELCGGTADDSSRAWVAGAAAGTVLLLLGLWRSGKRRAAVSGVGRPLR